MKGEDLPEKEFTERFTAGEDPRSPGSTSSAPFGKRKIPLIILIGARRSVLYFRI
jgi:hypothetical protein